MLGAGAGAVALNPAGVAAAPGRRAVPHGTGFLPPDHFGRMFRLAPFAQQSLAVETALRELGKPGGLLDAADPLAAGPKALIVDPSLSANNPNNPNHTAGTTFFGQFLDHDMTFDAGSRLARATNPEDARNFRTPALDLDSVYGAGPVAQQELYDPVDHIKLKVESGGLFEDLPRRTDGTAIVGDPRNDENLIVAGLHCAFLRFHNHAVDYVRDQGVSDTADVFARGTPAHHLALPVARRARVPAADRRPRSDRRRAPAAVAGSTCRREARRSSRSSSRPAPSAWGTAWCVPRTEPISPATTGNRSSRSCSTPRRTGSGRSRRPPRRPPRAAAIHRLANVLRLRRRRGEAEQEDRHQALDPALQPSARCDREPRRTHGSAPTQPAPAPHMAAPLGAERRARHGRPAARHRRPARTGRLGVGFERSTPLWYYVLKEAEVVADGLHLGPVGGRIVAEVFVGLLESDPASYLAAPARWQPTLPTRSGEFRMTDFLAFAGVDPAGRGQ